MLQRQKRKVNLCTRNVNIKKVEAFNEPVEVWIDVQPMTDTYLLESIGNIDKRYMTAKVVPSVATLFHKGDRCYIDAEVPTEWDELCLDADYKVVSVKTVCNVTEITFEGLL